MRSDAILMRLLELHPKIIDLSLVRMERLLQRLDHPERKLPPVVHIAGTNGKGSTLAITNAIMAAAGLKVHAYVSPHLVRFHERIRLAGELISEPELVALLEECEAANGSIPITFFEITTAAALLAFSRQPADYLLLEVGLGGRLDATNVINRPAVSVITSIGLDHQQYLGSSVLEIAREKAGILKPGVTGVVGVNAPEVTREIEQVAAYIGAPLEIAGQTWRSHAQDGRLMFQDRDGLLDLPMPALTGPHQIDNAGNALAALCVLQDKRITPDSMAQGLRQTIWPARMQNLGAGHLRELVTPGTELWLDGGHNAPAGPMIASSLRALAATLPKPLVLVWGMLNSKTPNAFIACFRGLADAVICLTIPAEVNAISATDLAQVAKGEGLSASAALSLQEALAQACVMYEGPRILICGSLYLAGHVLALHSGEESSSISGAAKR